LSESVELSVIIPTYNRVGRLRACLEALARQTVDTDAFEVVVVVDGSTDQTLAMLQEFSAPYRLRRFWQDNSGQSAALNRGLREAYGQFCLFVDDDILLAPDALAEHLRAQRSGEKVLGVGQILLSLPAGAGWYQRAFAEGWRRHYAALNEQPTSLSWEDCYSGNLSAPRNILLECGGFASNLGRGLDVELAFRLCDAGCSIQYLPEAVGQQDERKGFKELSRDAEGAGIADVRLYLEDPAKLSSALSSFSSVGWRKLLLRRILLGLRIPPRLLALAGPLLRHPERRYSWHSFLQNLCYWRGVRRAAQNTALWRQLTQGTPILVYHAVGDASEPAGSFVIPGKRFDTHLRWITRFGFRVISLDELVAYWRENRFPPARSVVITFDDGYADNYASAGSILRKHNAPATIFLVSECMGRNNTWDKSGALAGRPIMRWTEAREMLAWGICFGAHTRTHAALCSATESEVEREIVGSREEIEGQLRTPIAAFAYPYGIHSESVRRMVARSGYAAACTVDPGLNGPATPIHALRRAEIQGTDSVVRLWLALQLGDAEALRRRKRS
jgi:glycosyltransferase involved in cell wall biosynthesis/peptidoglycan/xylan/chitin deacetylase (PgdA/CDA1 family)